MLLSGCSVDGRTAFEIHQEAGDAFRTSADLYTPGGYFVRVSDSPTPGLIAASGEALHVRGVTMEGNVFHNCRIGIWLRSNGSMSIGVS